MSNELITINKLELASELAHAKLIANWSESIKMYKYEYGNNAITNYSDEAQDIFNEYYDDYIALIENCKA